MLSLTRLSRAARLLLAGVIDARAALRVLRPSTHFVVGREHQVVFVDTCDERQAMGCSLSEMERAWEGQWRAVEPQLAIRPAVYRDPEKFYYPAVESLPWQMPRVGAPRRTQREAEAAAASWISEWVNKCGSRPREDT